MGTPFSIARRRLLQALAAAGASALAWPLRVRSEPAAAPLTRRIPSTGETLPVIGLGSWITFNVGNDPVARAACTEVMRQFFATGGRLIDSSPMYGSSQAVIGEGLVRLGRPAQLFSADKVWIHGAEHGRRQIAASGHAWTIPRFDLLQVHNLLSWQAHLDTLFAMKAAGELRYVGITTSEGRRHAEFEHIMRSRPLDFVQFSYNILDREAERRLLPLARERGMAVLVNRPFRQGALIDALVREPLPPWAAEIESANWAQFLLKFIVSHPAVSCAIPATSRVDHLLENMGAARGPLPDEAMRRRMIAYVEAL